MSFAQYRALEALASQNPMHISWLARMLRLSRQVRTSDRAPARREHGLVDTVDEGYEVVIYVEPAARERLALCRKAVNGVRTNLEDRLSIEQRARLFALAVRADRALQPPPPRTRPWWLD